jgi:hypothetical protein
VENKNISLADGKVRIRKMQRIATMLIVSALVAFVASAAVFSAEPVPSVVEKAPAAEVKTAEAKVTIEADDATLKDLIAKVAEQSKKKIVAESTVKGTISHISAKDVTVEGALSTICKAGKCEWRKVYLPSDSKLLEQPDKLASTVRLVTAMGFPEVLISGASNGKVAAHYTQDKSVKSVQDIAAKDPSLAEVYVITNDMAVAEKPKEEGKSDSSALEEYVKQSKELMEKFVKMTPEEQERAMLEGITMFENMDPSYMASAMRAMSKMDPGVFSRMSNRGTDMMLAMSQEDRRAFLKMSMRAQTQISPEVQKMLQEDAMAVMEEIKAERGQNPNP